MLSILLFCCFYGRSQSASDSLTIPLLPDINFNKGNVVLTKKAKSKLNRVFQTVGTNPVFKIKVTSHSVADEESQQTSWDMVASVITYLKAKGIKEERFIFSYGEEGDPQTVNLKGTFRDDGLSWVPAPLPCFSYLKLTPKRCKLSHK